MRTEFAYETANGNYIILKRDITGWSYAVYEHQGFSLDQGHFDDLYISARTALQKELSRIGDHDIIREITVESLKAAIYSTDMPFASFQFETYEGATDDEFVEPEKKTHQPESSDSGNESFKRKRIFNGISKKEDWKKEMTPIPEDHKHESVEEATMAMDQPMVLDREKRQTHEDAEHLEPDSAIISQASDHTEDVSEANGGQERKNGASMIPENVNGREAVQNNTMQKDDSSPAKTMNLPQYHENTIIVQADAYEYEEEAEQETDAKSLLLNKYHVRDFHINEGQVLATAILGGKHDDERTVQLSYTLPPDDINNTVMVSDENNMPINPDSDTEVKDAAIAFRKAGEAAWEEELEVSHSLDGYALVSFLTVSAKKTGIKATMRSKGDGLSLTYSTFVYNKKGAVKGWLYPNNEFKAVINPAFTFDFLTLYDVLRELPQRLQDKIDIKDAAYPKQCFVDLIKILSQNGFGENPVDAVKRFRRFVLEA